MVSNKAEAPVPRKTILESIKSNYFDPVLINLRLYKSPIDEAVFEGVRSVAKKVKRVQGGYVIDSLDLWIKN